MYCFSHEEMFESTTVKLPTSPSMCEEQTHLVESLKTHDLTVVYKKRQYIIFDSTTSSENFETHLLTYNFSSTLLTTLP